MERSNTPHRRGRSHSRGRHGRGNKGRTNKHWKRSNDGGKRIEKEYKFATQSTNNSLQYASYNTVKDKIAQHIQKIYRYGMDIAKCIREMRVINLDDELPEPQISTLADETAREKQQKVFDMKLDKALDRHMARENYLQENLPKAYALIMDEYVTKTMRDRIEEQADFETKIQNNPIALLEVIKTLTHNPVRAVYPLKLMTEALKRFVMTKQESGESLADWGKRFQQLRDVLKSQLKTCMIDGFCENLTDYTEIMDDSNLSGAEKTHLCEQLREKQFEAWMAYMFISNSDHDKYGSLKKKLSEQFALGTDQYPKTLSAAVDALSSHQFDQTYFDKMKKKRDQEARDRNSNDNEETGKGNSFSQQKKDFICYCCGGKGHTTRNCEKVNTIPKSEWYVNKTMAHAQMENNTDTPSSGNRRSETTNNNTDNNETGWHGAQYTEQSRVDGWCGAQLLEDGFQLVTRKNNKRGTSNNTIEKSIPLATDNPYAALSENEEGGTTPAEGANYKQIIKRLMVNMKKVLLMDSGSNIVATIGNKDFLKNIRLALRPMDMNTNAGNKLIELEGDLNIPELSKLGKGWYDKNFPVNIISLAAVSDLYHVTYDNMVEDAIIVHIGEGRVIKFVRIWNNLYAYIPPEMEATALVQTVEENKKAYTDRQFMEAKRAREYYRNSGCPSVETFKKALAMNLFKNMPITTRDVDIAERIFGPDMGALKGKTKRKQPKTVKDDYIEIPAEIMTAHQNMTLCVDLLYVNGRPFLTGVDRTVKLRSAEAMNDGKAADELLKAVTTVVRQYDIAGFNVVSIHVDGEFKPVFEDVQKDLKAILNFTDANEHVPEAENNNRIIKERVRTMYHNMPYHVVPHLVMEHLVKRAVRQLNYFPAKGGVSAYFSPFTIINKKAVDAKTELQYATGSYVQAHDGTDNTPSSRTLDCIYLSPNDSKQGGHYLMNIHTGRLVHRTQFDVLPVTQLVIDAVENLAYMEGVKSFKIRGRNKKPIFPADWIAGVDYDEELEYVQDDEYENDSNTSDDEEYDNDLDDERYYDRVDPEEMGETRTGGANPTDRQDDEHNDDAADNGVIENELVEAEAEPEEIAEQPAEVSDEDESTVDTTTRTRSGREVRPVERMNLKQTKTVRFADDVEKKYNLFATNLDEEKSIKKNTREYDIDTAPVAAHFITEINARVSKEGAGYAQQYMLQAGIKKFGDRGRKGATKEIDQLHQRNCFSPVDVSQLTPGEKRKAVEALMFLTEKRDGTIKGRMVYNGKPTREWMTKEDTASPTVTTESIMLTTVIDAKEGRDVMTSDVPNAFIQTNLPEPKAGEERIIMKITGVLVELLCELAPETYGKYVVYEKGVRVLYVQVLKALYGMLVAALLWYRKFKADLEGTGFEFNPYDPCVANKMVDGKQHTVRFHVDDLMSSHVDPKVNDEFHKWLNKMYGSYGEVKTTRGKVHDYLGMTFDFSTEGKVIIDMIDYIKNMVDEFSVKLGADDVAPDPAASDLFQYKEESKSLDKDRAAEFHTVVAKGLFASKRARADIHTAIAALCTRVKNPNEHEWNKLVRLMKYLNGTQGDKLILSADNLHVIKWYVDAAFAVHPDFKSHTGGGMTFGKGFIGCRSQKQKLNTRSSTEAELVGADDLAGPILWTKLFMEAQGYEVERNILYQDNKSAILLETNGKKSSSKRTRAINIRYFFLTDQVEKGNLSIEYCPTTKMTGDYFTKPKQGYEFKWMKSEIMGHEIPSRTETARDGRSVLTDDGQTVAGGS
jgi:hypothetical protein